MKLDKNQLDVDFIGGQGLLTNDEAIAISEFIRAEKAKRTERHVKQIAKSQKHKETTL